MENLVTKRPAAEGTRRNFFVSTAKKLNEKRKKIALSITTACVMSMATTIAAFAEAGGGLDDNAGKAQFDTLVKFFMTWIGRIGLVVAFVGAVMFGFAIKQEDAEGKQRGLMTLASGIIVFAVSTATGFFLQ